MLPWKALPKLLQPTAGRIPGKAVLKLPMEPTADGTAALDLEPDQSR